jgi:hypothetical protein
VGLVELLLPIRKLPSGMETILIFNSDSGMLISSVLETLVCAKPVPVDIHCTKHSATIIFFNAFDLMQF